MEHHQSNWKGLNSATLGLGALPLEDLDSARRGFSTHEETQPQGKISEQVSASGQQDAVDMSQKTASLDDVDEHWQGLARHSNQHGVFSGNMSLGNKKQPIRYLVPALARTPQQHIRFSHDSSAADLMPEFTNWIELDQPTATTDHLHGSLTQQLLFRSDPQDSEPYQWKLKYPGFSNSFRSASPQSNVNSAPRNHLDTDATDQPVSLFRETHDPIGLDQIPRIQHLDGSWSCGYAGCSNSFKRHARESELKSHQRIHEEKRFLCDQCTFSARFEAHLKSHQESVHGQAMYYCRQCPRGYTSYSNLRRHYHKKHRGKEVPRKEVVSIRTDHLDKLGKYAYTSDGLNVATRGPAKGTDEGYYSKTPLDRYERDGLCIELDSVLTDNRNIGEGVRTHTRGELLRRFARELVDSLVIKELADDVLELLPDIIKDFSRRLGHKAIRIREKRAINLVRHYRRDIVRNLLDHKKVDTGRGTLDVPTIDGYSWASWVPDSDAEAVMPERYVDTDGPELGGEYVWQKALEFLFRSTDFSWLVGQIERASRTMTTGPQFAAFRDDLARFMPSVTPQVVNADVDWNPHDFLDQQYLKGSGVTIGTVITYCGTGDLIEAVGCKDYIYHLETDSSMDTTTVKVHIQDRKLRACIEGDSVAILEILEVLSWLGAACRTSQNPEQAMYCSPSLSKLNGLDCTISFNITALPSEQVPVSLSASGQEETPDLITPPSNKHTYCWSQLVRNPVIIKGYPVSRRHNDEKGLEIELGLMSQLATAARVMVFDGLLMLKSFNSMFVAVAEASGSLLWHYILSPYGRPVPYRKARKFCQDKVPVPVGALQHGRHFVGLTQPSTILTGTADANYDIDPTGDNFIRGGVAIKDFTLGVSRTFTISAKVVPGRQDTRVSLSKPECFQVEIQKAKSTPVVFYDVEEKRAWMVDGQDAVLHLSRAHLSSRFAEPAESGTSAELIRQFRHRSVVNGRWQTSSEVLCDPKNLRISVGHTYQSAINSGDQGSPSHSTSPGMCFQDVVVNNVQVLRDIVAYQQDMWQLKKDQIRVRIPLGAKKQIVGFGFTDIVSLETRLRPRFAKLKFSGPGWKKYTNKADAIYILGSGFGELHSNTSDCTKCTGVPPGYEFLVVSARMLQRLEDIRGISWGLPDVPVLAQEKGRSISCHCAESVHGVRCGIAVTELGARSTPADRSGDKQRNKVARLQSDEYLIIGRKDDMSNARRAMQLNGSASSACDGCDIQELVRGQGLGGVGPSAMSDTSNFTPARSTSNQDSGYDTGMVDQTTDDSSPSQSSGKSDQPSHSHTQVANGQQPQPSHDALPIPAESLRHRPTARDDQRTLPMFSSLAINGSTTTGNIVHTPRLAATRRRTRKLYPPAPGASTAFEYRGC
ncbi:hypothetical protein LTR97_001148 [Elasticomyces elasticus]|uniref:C2H2-type domain-containing protein n=1 Tax=Elasticomyces elasticus TaxID=574655 RepID=A0AAN7WIF1_9PEZI|nr:hypothetical protein LTR97_001148 [Elasticomyces elasticus]